MADNKRMKKSTGAVVRRIVAYVVLIFLSLLCVFWFYLMFVNSTRSHSEIQLGASFVPSTHFFDNLKSVFTNSVQPMGNGLFNSFLISTLTAVLSVYFSTMTAYSIHVYDYKGKKAVFTGILMIMMIPTQVTVLGFIQWIGILRNFNKSIAMKTGWDWLVQLAKGNNAADYIWLILPSIAAPVTFYYLKQYMESALPLSLIEAARIDGSSEVRTFNEIALPLVKPALAVQAIFAFVSSWNNYFVPSRILTGEKSLKTVPLLIAELRSADFIKFDMGQVYMSIFAAIFPSIVVYLILSRNIVGGVALGSVKG